MVQPHSDVFRASELRWRGAAPGIPPEMVDEFMAELKAGSTVRKLTSGGKKFGPALVTFERFKKHCKLHPEWAAEAWRISKINAGIGKGAHLRNLTHCRHGHPFAGENLYVSPDGKERRCWTCMQRNGSFGRRMSEDQARKVVEALNEGKTIANITKSATPSYILNHRALLLFRQKIRSSIDLSFVAQQQMQKFIALRHQHAAHKFSGRRLSLRTEPTSSCSFDLRSRPTCQHRSETT